MLGANSAWLLQAGASMHVSMRIHIRDIDDLAPRQLLNLSCDKEQDRSCAATWIRLCSEILSEIRFPSGRCVQQRRLACTEVAWGQNLWLQSLEARGVCRLKRLAKQNSRFKVIKLNLRKLLVARSIQGAMR